MKIKSITISHDQLTCKLVDNEMIIEQVMQINYLGGRLPNNVRVNEEMMHQFMKAKRTYQYYFRIVHEYLIWSNKYLTQKQKLGQYVQ